MNSNEAYNDFLKLEKSIIENKININRKQLLNMYFIYCQKNKLEIKLVKDDDKKYLSQFQMSRTIYLIFGGLVTIASLPIFFFANFLFGGVLFVTGVALAFSVILKNTDRYEQFLSQSAHISLNNQTSSLVSDLKNLEELYKNGSLNESEYKLAKENIINLKS